MTVDRTDPVRILGFVNHIAPSADIEEAIERAFSWGVDVVVAQGTGSDWGPYWLGSGEQVSANQAANVEPYVRAALGHGVPVRLLVRHRRRRRPPGDLPAGLRRAVRAQRLAPAGRRDPLRDRQGLLRDAVAERASGRCRASDAGRRRRSPLDRRRRRRAHRRADRPRADHGRARPRGLDGVLTGRALDIGLFMALPMLHGLPTAVAAHAGKLLECGGLALQPGDSGRAIWASVDAIGFEVRSPHDGAAPSVRSLVSHTFYERAHPTLEENPGGTLDLSAATYEELEIDGWVAVRCEGAELDRGAVHGADGGRAPRGLPRGLLLGVREPALLAQARDLDGRRGGGGRRRAAVRRRDRRGPAEGAHPDLRARRRPRLPRAEPGGDRSRGGRARRRRRRHRGAREGGRVLRVHPVVHRPLPGPQDDRRQRGCADHAGRGPGVRRLQLLDLPPAAAGRPGRAVPVRRDQFPRAVRQPALREDVAHAAL